MSRNAVRFAFAAASAAAAASMAAGCSSSGGSTSTPPPSGSPSATASVSATARAVATSSCGVITRAQASAALGGQAIHAVRIGNATVEGGKACVYYGPNVPASVSPNIAVGDTVRVVLVTGPKAKKYFDDYRRKVKAQPISGLGDAAYYDGYASISVLKGAAYVRIAVGVADNLGPEKILAKDALATI